MKLPGVGLASIVIKDNLVLLGKRKNAHGAGTYAFPGGHLEMFESFIDCAIRETEEETGLIVDPIDIHPSAVTNDFFKELNKHYITLFMRTKYISGNPENLEPHKCEGWNWYEWEKMPSNLMIPIKNLIKQGYNPFKLK